MCYQSAACNLHWHICQARAPWRGCIELHLILYSINNTATDWWCVMSHSNTPTVRKHTTDYSKICKTKSRKHLQRTNLSWNTCQDFKITSLREAALETEWSCFSKVFLESNVTPNTSKSSDSFSTVPPIVKGTWARDLCE